MITVELTKKVNMPSALKIFMEKMNEAENSIQEQGYFTEEEVEIELAKV